MVSAFKLESDSYGSQKPIIETSREIVVEKPVISLEDDKY